MVPGQEPQPAHENASAAQPGSSRRYRQVSGIYPHLAFFNDESECGTGAVVPWAGRLWAVTYAPHKPLGSSDRLYEIDEQLNVSIRPESVGGTPAGRLIHRESEQLFIGPYAIDRHRNVRVIPYGVMPGRLTGIARHLTDPGRRIYYATMEEGFYEVDVHSLKVTELYPDTNRAPNPAGDILPGCHGKGFYSAQGRVVYANNGERSQLALSRPDIPSGCLAEWDGKAWTVVRRNQFTEVTGPGGIHGNENPEHDPLWSIGWDHRSLILMLLDAGRWHAFRLPKASHCYDGAHGWNTEWPRIRDIDEDDLLMTMHGMFWRFPRSFSAANTAGIAPRSTYLKVVGDFCPWRGRIVFGCDDTAKSEFLNKRKAKGNLVGPGQSQSNLWFVPPDRIDGCGPPLGRGAVWLNDPVKAGDPSDPYLLAGFDRRGAHLAHGSPHPVTFLFEVDMDGTGKWQKLREVAVPGSGYVWSDLSGDLTGQWIRVRTDRDCEQATVFLHYAGKDKRGRRADPIFASLATSTDRSVCGGLVRARGENLKTLHLAALTAREGRTEDAGYYELDADLKLRRVDDPEAHAWLGKNAAIPEDVLTIDDASVLYIDDAGRRFRLPKGHPAFDKPGALGLERIDREVVTERDLFNCHGTFYELPARNAGGFAKIRPIATHNRRIKDYCSWRGLLVLTGISTDAPRDTHHVIRSEDGRAAVWVGVVDDLWKLGKPVGRGGPWKDTPVRAGIPSDPYLMTGYDWKTLFLSHRDPGPATMTVQVDITGTGLWKTYRSFDVPPREEVTHEFPDAFQAYWIRTVASQDTVASAQLAYE